MPILNKSRYFGVSSMSDGLRVSGTVEIAGLEAPPALARAKVLVTQAKRLFPDLAFDEETYWMGHRPSLPDGLPAIGEIPAQPGLFACFGHGHSGLTAAPASGQLVAQLATGEPPPIDPGLFSPARFS
jgi:D-amino-acid dehydrogenase